MSADEVRKKQPDPRYSGRVSRIARAHQEGLRERVRSGGPSATYAKRPLIGISLAERKPVTK
ncbi:phage virion morphogenesis protein [Xanthomonas arboricola]|uniref:phage virion morphogenesis protein n=1 Tax=Xanthomonas arboricola TaxID=56448 RepID=UPI00161214A2|nr:phage virion morphogenesis protein [Xanthomonas arboricola]